MTDQPAPRGRGRPALGKHQHSFSLSDDAWEGLQRLAEASGWRAVQPMMEAIGNAEGSDGYLGNLLLGTMCGVRLALKRKETK